MWVEWPFNDVFLLEYVIMKKLTIFFEVMIKTMNSSGRGKIRRL